MQQLSLPGKALLAGLALALPAFAAKRQTYLKPVIETMPAATVTQVVVQNLVGPISIQAGAGDQIHLEAIIHAGGTDQVFAKALADQLTFSVKQVAGQLRIEAIYPLDHFRDYGYPMMKSIIGIHGTDSNEYDGEKVFIRDVNSDKAVELWAEIRLTLPTRVGLVIRNTYGDVEVRSTGAASAASFDGFTDVGDFEIHSPRWANLKIQSDYGKVDLPDGFGVAQDIHVNTDVGGTYVTLAPGATGQIIASKDLGFLHNDFSEARFAKNDQGQSVMTLGDGHGTILHVDMNVGSLHLKRAGDLP